MCVHVNGLDSLAVDHHRQALAAAALLSPRRIPQPTTAENDAGRGAGTLEKIPARVHVRLPADISTERPEQRDVIRSLAISFVCPNKFKAVPTAVPHVPTLEGPLPSRWACGRSVAHLRSDTQGGSR